MDTPRVAERRRVPPVRLPPTDAMTDGHTSCGQTTSRRSVGSGADAVGDAGEGGAHGDDLPVLEAVEEEAADPRHVGAAAAAEHARAACGQHGVGATPVV